MARKARLHQEDRNAMNRTSTLPAAALLALLSSFASAQQPPAGDNAQRIATQVCAACHGADGNSPVAANPSLAAQPADYITRQLANFKAGLRVNPIMQPIASTLSDADMRALGEYFSKQQAKGSAARDAALVKTGQALYRGGDATSSIPACAACHSPDGVGIPKNFPRLAGQWADYTYRQLQAFKSGERGNDQAGKDVNGRIMGAIAQNMSDTQMRALADYVAGLR
jgi:cytochrome c553